MNRILGFMNVVLLAIYLIMLIVGGGGVDRENIVVGTALTFVPITFTMLALEPKARFLRTALTTNALYVALVCVGSAGAATIAQLLVILLPFLLNIAGLAWVWVRVRRERRERELESSADDSPDEALAQSEPEDLADNYFARHWLGQLSLPVSYWVNVWGATAVCAGVILAADRLLTDVSLRAASAVALAASILLLAVGCWSTVGAWRSAERHTSRGGAAGWAIAAQILVVFGAVGTVSNFFLYLKPQMKEHWLIATGRDPLGQIDVQFTRDRTGLVLNGTLGAGSANKVKAALDGAPGVKTIVLESYGGRNGEANRIASLIRERRLDTYVEGHCESACTFILLAGADRAATADAQIGFHRGSFPGMDRNLDKAMMQDMLADYRAAGLPEEFLERVRTTPASDMWYPTSSELIEAQVVLVFRSAAKPRDRANTARRPILPFSSPAIRSWARSTIGFAAPLMQRPYLHGSCTSAVRAMRTSGLPRER